VGGLGKYNSHAYRHESCLFRRRIGAVTYLVVAVRCQQRGVFQGAELPCIQLLLQAEQYKSVMVLQAEQRWSNQDQLQAEQQVSVGYSQVARVGRLQAEQQRSIRVLQAEQQKTVRCSKAARY